MACSGCYCPGFKLYYSYYCCDSESASRWHDRPAKIGNKKARAFDGQEDSELFSCQTQPSPNRMPKFSKKIVPSIRKN